MKTTLAILSMIVLSAQAHAGFEALNPSAQGSLLVTFSPAMSTTIATGTTSNGSVGKEARQIMEEGQEYFQTGEMGLLIASKVETLQEEQDMSVDEAIDLLMVRASKILN